MTELCSSLSVVFSSYPEIDDHLFAKAIRWADQNPDDSVLWARRKTLKKIPTVSVEWSSKISALRRIRFMYNRKNLLRGCIDEAVKQSMGTDVAAIICSISPPRNGSQMGSLLAALAHFCNANDGRAVLLIDLRDDGRGEEDDDNDEEDEEETDPFENEEFLDEQEEEKELVAQKTSKREEEHVDSDAHIAKLKVIAAMYTHKVYTFDGDKEQFISCL